MSRSARGTLMNIRTLAFAVCRIAVGGPGARSPSEPAPPPPPAMPANLTPAQQKVAHVQMALNANGAALDVDGKWGSKTSAALAAFQKSHNLKPTGKMNGTTAKALGL